MPVARVDSHVHTDRCGHAVGCAEEYVRAAESAGIDVITFTEHVPLPEEIDPDRSYAMTPEQWPEYISEIRSLRSDSVKILLGAEADWLPGRMEHVETLLAQADWDVVLGSVHMLDGWAFDDPALISRWDERDVDAVWEQYFATFADAARSGVFDVMAHPDLVKKFGHVPEGGPGRHHRAAAEVLAESGRTIEVSTGGLRKPCAELYPSEEFLRACAQCSVPATTGSDAHSPTEVGADLDAALDSLGRAGYAEVVYFERRSPVVVSL